MLTFFWSFIIIASVLYSFLNGMGDKIMQAMASGASEAVRLCITLVGSYALWQGILELMQRIGLTEKISKCLGPVVKRLFPNTETEAMQYISLNIAANMLGMGNAATPSGINAARLMARDEKIISNDLIMFLVINASSVQLIPTTVISLRASYASAAPADIILPTLISTLVSTVTGIILCKGLSKWSKA